MLLFCQTYHHYYLPRKDKATLYDIRKNPYKSLNAQSKDVQRPKINIWYMVKKYWKKANDKWCRAIANKEVESFHEKGNYHGLLGEGKILKRLLLLHRK
jgi:hypothetical protein